MTVPIRIGGEALLQEKHNKENLQMKMLNSNITKAFIVILIVIILINYFANFPCLN